MHKDALSQKADELAHKVYKPSRSIPPFERYAFALQLRRAALSIILNIVEGYARQGQKEFHRFLLISYGSYKETKYLLEFGLKEGYFNESEIGEVMPLAEEVGALLWTYIIKKSVQRNAA